MSDFGSGIVVCLAKFSEHLREHGPYSELVIREFADIDEAEREQLRAKAERHPRGDAALTLARLDVLDVIARFRGREAAISEAIHLWMNGASDHFYGLDESAPEPLRELADLTLRIGHGYAEEVWTIETIDRIRELWRLSCLAIDERLGVEADWGEW